MRPQIAAKFIRPHAMMLLAISSVDIAKGELLLSAFAALAEAECTRVQNEPSYQVVIYRCEECGAVGAA